MTRVLSRTGIHLLGFAIAALSATSLAGCGIAATIYTGAAALSGGGGGGPTNNPPAVVVQDVPSGRAFVASAVTVTYGIVDKEGDAATLEAEFAVDPTLSLPDDELRFQPATLFSATAGTITATNVLTGVNRKSTRLNSSHSQISYAVFCLKK